MQLGAFRERENALEVQTRAAVDFSGVEIRTEDGWHRVRIGHFSKRSEAEDLVRRLRQRGFDAVLVPLS